MFGADTKLQDGLAARPRISPRGRRLTLALSLLAAIAASILAPGAPGTLGGPEVASAEVVPAGSLPSPRTRTSAVWANGSAYIFGGRTGSPIFRTPEYSSTRDIVRFTPGVGATVVGQLPPTPEFVGTPRDGREDTAAIWDGSNAYIFGGYDSFGEPLDEIVRFDPSTGAVEVVANLPLPTAPGGAAAVWDGQSAYIFGGYVPEGRGSNPFPEPQPPIEGGRPELSNQIVRFTPDAAGGTATTLTATLPSPRNHVAAVYESPYIHIYGGHTGRDDTDEILSFAPASGSFDDFGVRLPSPRHDASAIWLPDAGGGSAYIFGGAASSRDDNSTDEIVAHDPDFVPYDPVPGSVGSVEVVDRLNPPVGLLFGGSAHVSAVASDPVGGYLFGGESGVGNRDLSDRISRFTRPVRYVALGDSYSSGEGLAEDFPPYLEGGDPTCHRHRFAYSQLFQFHGPTQLDFFACSGARTEHIYRNQQNGAPGSTRTQADSRELNASTDLVTITIGGNDVGKPDDAGNGGLKDPLQFCLFRTNCHKNAAFVKRLRSNVDKVAEKLRRTLLTLKQRTGPDTAIFLLGYPRVFPTDDDPAQLKREQNCKSLSRRIVRPGLPVVRITRVGWTAGEQVFLNGALDRLNALSSRVAAATGVYFIDVTERFTGHAICDEGDGGSWITPFGVKVSRSPVKPSSFHPNVAGQLAYAAALRGQIDFLVSLIERGSIAGGRLTPIGLPANPQPTTRPSVRLNKVRTVRLGKRSNFRGTISSEGGIARATLDFGDRSKRRITIRKGGSFRLLHRYRTAGKFTARLVVVDKEGNKAMADVKVRVERPKRKRRR